MSKEKLRIIENRVTEDIEREEGEWLISEVKRMYEETEIKKGLDYNELFQFMQEFKADFLNMYGELIIDEKTNTYTFINTCNDIEDVKTRVIYSLCRPIGKGLELQGKSQDATRLLKRVNDYFKIELTKEDMLLMYQELCYERKLGEFKYFIKRGFPMGELKGE
jgi:hypothetical protein